MSTQPHDGLFKAIFGQIDYAREELRSLLPEAIAAAIDWSTLSLEPGNFVDAQLSERETDLRLRALRAPERGRCAHAVSLAAL